MFLLLNVIPTKPFNCAKIIITEVADVKPEIAGAEIKSTIKPEIFNFNFT